MKTPPKIINVIERSSGKVIQEKVLGREFMEICYGTRAGLSVTTKIFTRKLISSCFGRYNDSILSKKNILPFIKEYNINQDEIRDSISSFRSFNEFFYRHLKPNARAIDANPKSVVSPGDGRLLVFPEIQNDTLAYIKWAPLKLLDLFGGNAALAQDFRGGACAVLRLCPVDYHRFHFPLAGRVGESKVIEGLLHSVSPYALEQKIPVFCLNKRTVCPIETDSAGLVIAMEVGALMVGSIKQTYKPNSNIKKGDEKGFFEFGGSSTLLFFKKGKIQFDADLVKNSAAQLETQIRCGEAIGTLLQ